MRHLTGLAAAVVLFSSTPAPAQTPVLAQQPALSAKEVVFVFAGDLWIVPRSGGDARRLTTGSGVESNPSFSPDGNWVTFTGQYDGNVDVFVVPAQGGVPKRLTWHPDPDTALGWTRDGKRVLFSSTRTSYSRFRELYLVGLDGGLEEKLPLPMGFEAAFSPIGRPPRVCAAVARVHGVEALSGRPGDADLDRPRFQQPRREDPARSIERLLARCGSMTGSIFSATGTSRSRSTHTTSRQRRWRRPSRTPAWISSLHPPAPARIVLEQFGQIQLYNLASGRLSPEDLDRRGHRRNATEVHQRREAPDQRAHLADRRRALFEARGRS